MGMSSLSELKTSILFIWVISFKSKQNTIELMAEGSTGQTEMNRQRLQNEIIVTFPESKDLQKRIAEYGLAIDKKNSS